jgi:hypothetical protein
MLERKLHEWGGEGRGCFSSYELDVGWLWHCVPEKIHGELGLSYVELGSNMTCFGRNWFGIRLLTY